MKNDLEGVEARPEESDARKKMTLNKKRTPSETGKNSIQYDLFGQFLSNDSDDVSNTVEIWERIPKYFPAQVTSRQIKEDGVQPLEWDYLERDEKGHCRQFKVVIQPAMIKQSNSKYKAVFPGKTEEVIEESLKKILSDQRFGMHNSKTAETWVRFTLSMLFRELKERGCTRSRDEIKQAIQVMSKCNIAVFIDDKEVWNGAILQDLVTVGRGEYLEDTNDAQHIARLPLFITRAIDRLEYRQFNYARLMSCREQLSRWIYKRLVNRYKQADHTNSYHFTLEAISQSGLLQQGRDADKRKKVKSALEELIKKDVICDYEDEVIAREGRRATNIKYTLYPSDTFITEQKAANKRAKDQRLKALNTGWMPAEA